MKQCVAVDQLFFKNITKTNVTEHAHKGRKVSSKDDTLDTAKLDIALSPKGFQIYGKWSKTRLLTFLTDKLQRCIKSQSALTKNIEFTNSGIETQLRSTLYSGLYSMHVLKELEERGMPQSTILKTMKLGLSCLTHCDLLHFKKFNVDPYVLEFENMWVTKFDDELISNLRPIGFNEHECWHIIVFGVAPQNVDVLYRLVLSGIDIPGILNWQSTIHSASSKVIQFLRNIGIEENVVDLVEHYGIDDETFEMLIDLGLDEIPEEPSKEIICECSLSALESNASNSGGMRTICKTTTSDSTSTSINTPDNFPKCNCNCWCPTEKDTVAELTARQNDYLRQNVMAPLSWAMSRALKFGPSDACYYIAYELLRWKNNSVSQKEKDNVQDYVALSTVEMDQKFISERCKEEEEYIKTLNAEAMENIPCERCRDRQQFYPTKKQCQKCATVPVNQNSCDTINQ